MSSDGAKLVRAASKGDDAKVKRLLKAKVDVNYNMIGEAGGITPLYAACGLGHVGGDAGLEGHEVQGAVAA